MNQKIKLLWEQSSQRTDIMDEQRYEFFAKLIIEEVIKIMADSQNYNRCVHTHYDLDRAKCIVQELSKKIYGEFL